MKLLNKYSNQVKKKCSFQSNNSFDLWELGVEKHLNNIEEEDHKVNQIDMYTKYKPQLSIPHQLRQKANNSITLIKEPNKEHNEHRQHLTTKKQKINLSVDHADYQPTNNMRKFSNTKHLDQTLQKTNCKINKKSILKPNKAIEVIGTLLYKKKILSNDYEMQKLMKQMADENKDKQEMSQCTFKPKLFAQRLFHNKRNNSNIGKKTIYEQQSKWLDSVNSKNLKHFEEKMNKELKDCSFNPKTTKMPNFHSSQYQNEPTELYYMRKKNARRKFFQDKNERVDYAKNYDKRKKKAITKNGSYIASYLDTTDNSRYPKQINKLPSQETLNYDNDFEVKKSELNLNLHDWNDNNTEENDDDFFNYY